MHHHKVEVEWAARPFTLPVALERVPIPLVADDLLGVCVRNGRSSHYSVVTHSTEWWLVLQDTFSEMKIHFTTICATTWCAFSTASGLRMQRVLRAFQFL